MPAPWNSVSGKLQTACIAHIATITADITGVNQLQGQNDGAKELPYAIASVGEGNEEPLDTGNFMLPVTIQVENNADDTTEAVHRDRLAKIADLFIASDLASLLSGYVTDFHCIAVHSFGQAERIADGKWVNEISFTAYCCGSDL